MLLSTLGVPPLAGQVNNPGSIQSWLLRGWCLSHAGQKQQQQALLRGQEAGHPKVGAGRCFLGAHKQVRRQEKLTNFYKRK